MNTKFLVVKQFSTWNSWLVRDAITKELGCKNSSIHASIDFILKIVLALISPILLRSLYDIISGFNTDMIILTGISMLICMELLVL